MWVNSELFQTEAHHFKKYGYFCPDPPGSIGHKDYWTQQLEYCKNGYSVGGKRVTGDHYAYLNFGQIKLTQDTNKYAQVTKKKISSAHKIVTFPDFWDGDYVYYQAIEKAWEQGKHFIVFKARRKGFSYKNAMMVANRANTVKNSISLIGAMDTKYLYPTGTMSMASDYLNFFNEHTAFSKRRSIDRKDHIKLGYYQMLNGVRIEKGYKSQIIATTFKDNPDAARGKDATLILFEEGGAFDNLKNSYMATRPTVEDGDIVTGMIIIYGTGGDMMAGTVDLEEMFYNPEPYNLYPFNNEWDNDAHGTSCGFFFPVYQNLVGFIDSKGNSQIDEAKNREIGIREKIKETAKNPAVYDKYITEYPFSPAEGFMRTSNNIFPIGELNEWRNRLMISKKYNIGIPGVLSADDKDKVRFKPSDKIKPITKFPHNQNDPDLTGGVVIYQDPYRDQEGNVPSGLYLVVNDPYAFDKSTGISLGATYVYKYVNNYAFPDDWLVASYVGRPETQDEYNDNMFMLAEYYNAKIAFENDRGDVAGFAKRKGKLNMLSEEVSIIDAKENLNIKRLGRVFGISCGTEQRKSQGDIFIRDWLKASRGQDEDGKVIRNLHMIYDLALLDELLRYNPKGNFDRVSAIRILGFYMKARVIATRTNYDAPPERPKILSKTYFQ